MSTIYGNATISELQPRRVYRALRGWSTERRFRGVMAALNAQASAILAGSSNVEIELDPPHDDIGEGVMTVRVPDAADGSDPNASTTVTWACPNSTRDRSLLDSKAFLEVAYTGGDSSTAMLENGYYLTALFEDPEFLTLAQINALPTNAKILAKEIISGVKLYSSSVFTLRQTTSAPSGWTAPDLRQYLDVCFTQAQIVSLFDPPANIVTQMPSSPAGEYLCLRAELDQTDKGGWQMVMEWAHNPTSWPSVYTRWS
jgi:hypothetical protein